MHLSEMPGASDIMHMRAWRGDWFGFYNSSLWRGLVFGERPKHHALNFIETFLVFRPMAATVLWKYCSL
jgi:hypothetical protein